MIAHLARAADDVVHAVGINVHLGYLDGVYARRFHETIVPALTRLGVRHIRDSGTVVMDDPWMALVYARRTQLAKMGMRTCMVMAPALNSTIYDSVPHWDRLLQYAAPSAENFEGLNEHDLSKRSEWAEETRAFQSVLMAKVKADPRTSAMPVFGPSIGRPKNAAVVGTLAPRMNYASIHPYPGGGEPLTELAYHMTHVQPMSGARACVATETGYHTSVAWTGEHPGVSERAHALYLPRLILEFFAAGVVRTYLYELIDQGRGVTREHHFGLLRNDGSEKLGFTAVANLLALLSDGRRRRAPLGRLAYEVQADGPVSHLLLQKADGRFLLALWRPVPVYDLGNKRDVAPSPVPVRVAFAGPCQTRALTLDALPTAAVTADSATVVLAGGIVMLEVLP